VADVEHFGRDQVRKSADSSEPLMADSAADPSQT
jgi:hypothetical protein